MPILTLHNPPIYTAATAVYPYSDPLERHFIVKTKYSEEPTFLAKRVGDFLHVPRELAPIGEDRRSYGSKIEVNCTTDFKPDIYEVQKDLFDNSFGLLRAGVSHTMKLIMGGGKCEAKDTPVIMFNGEIKPIQAISVGDLVMGPDSLPREVLETTSGKGRMFKVTPIKGEPFTCNGEHILALKCSSNGHTISEQNNGFIKGNIVNISVYNYLSSSSAFKNYFKLWRTGVTFKEQPTTLDPYFFGLYVGDGGKDSPNITTCTKNVEVAAYLERKAAIEGVRISYATSKEGTGSTTRYFRQIGRDSTVKNKLMDYLSSLNWTPLDRSVPSEYFINSPNVQRSFLAGVLDSDGYKGHNGVYDIITKYPSVRDAILFAARSLGLAAYYKVTTKSIKSLGFVGDYFRICISGDCSELPILTERKKSTARLQKKSVLTTGFSIEEVPEDYYYGFMLTGDALYLHGDFTVTHNSYLATRLLCSVGVTTLIVVTKEDLMKQWKDNLLKYTNIKEDEIGFIRQDTCQVQGKKVVIGLVHSLSGREYPSYVYDSFGLVICDEVHRMSAETFSQVMFKFNSRIRLGLSATTVRPDGKSFIFESHIGKVLSSSDHVQISPKVLVVRTDWKLPKWRVKDEFNGGYKMVDMTVPKGRPAVVSKHMAISETRNNLLVDLCFKAYNKGRRIVMFFDSLKHIDIIRMKLLALGIPPIEIIRYVGGIKKADVEAVHTKRILLATYTYMSEGTDVPFLDTAILCSPRSNVSQAVGRILRKVAGKKDPIIMDVIDPCSKDIMASFESRVRQYKQLNAEIVDVS